ncbi:MAG: protease SohB [Pseudomonadota bacterium]
MYDGLIQLALFSAKAIIVVTLILILLAGIIALLTRGKDKMQGRITIKNLNEKYYEIQEALFTEILAKDKFKKYLKEQKVSIKKQAKEKVDKKNIFIVTFDGDIKASAVGALREEITAILSVATPQDEVVARVESGGGMVHSYGLAAAQLARIKEKHIPLTVTVDKVAASGGYLMACVANKILAAPFAIIGSIGVIIQLPNFNRLLREKHIDFEQLTAGNFKRTLTVFGHNTEEGREKLQEEIEDVHQLFKNVIQTNRQQVDIDKVATGEHWLGTQALALKLVDEVITSDDYLTAQMNDANLFEITYHAKKSLANKLTAAAHLLKRAIFKSMSGRAGLLS